MDKYYYLISQLPFLKFSEETYMDQKAFLREAEKWLSDKDLGKLKEADTDNLETEGRTYLLKKYKNFELNLRKEIATYRESRMKNKEYRPKGILTRSLLEGNPLEVERKLFLYRWQQIEELSEGFVFNLEAVIAYFLKLQILKKVLSFDKERGTRRFNSLTEVTDEKLR
ncbi:MAG: DUF2764 family protein [Candidatus Omnitrophica bacterium]|nr:DUF2764 family protein [Candidatus Omnitrophota bacterium]MBD3269006.1 DUF2764 family protein [Candidatus Omnitrophota bacterium]